MEKQMKKILSQLLVFMMLISCCNGFAVYADNELSDIDNFNASAGTLQTEPADEIISNDEIAFPTEIPESPEGAKLEIKELVSDTIKYSDLSSDEQKEIYEEYRLRDDVMNDCEAAGYDLTESIDKGSFLQMAGLSAEQYEQMIVNFGDEDRAKEEAEEFGNFKYAYPSYQIGKNPSCIGYLVSGYAAKDILKAKAFADFLEIPIENAMALNGDDLSSADLTISSIAEAFHVKVEPIEEYISSHNLETSDFDTMVTDEFADFIASVNGIETFASSDIRAEERSKIPNAPFSYDRNGTELINLMTGSVGYNETEITMPGANGLDLSLGVKYDSSLASNGDIYATTTTNKGAMEKMISPMTYFAAGWSFNFSYIKIFNAEFRNIRSTLVLGDGSRYGMDRSAMQDKDTVEISLRGYRSDELKDLLLYKDTSYSAEGQTSAYRLAYKDGKQEFFDEGGKLIKTENRFGDTITYKYITTGTENEDRYQEFNKVEIRDTRGQLTTIERGALEGTADLTKATQDIVVTLPDQSTIKYVVRNSWHPHAVQDGIITQVLVSKTNQIGMETLFEYIEDDVSAFSFLGAFVKEGEQPFYPLTKITHPTGLVTEYTYEHNLEGKIGPVFGSYDYYRILSRKDKFGAEEYNVYNYTYSDENYTQKNPFSVTVTNADGVSRQINYSAEGLWYDCLHLKQTEKVFYSDTDGVVKNISMTDYGTHKNYYEATYPLVVKSYVYGENGNTIESIENYEYNTNGDVVKYWNPRAGGDQTKTEHMTTMTYHDTYAYLTGKEYKRDSGTTVKEEYTPSTDGKTVSEKKIFENNNLISRETYQYETNSLNPSTINTYKTNTSNDKITTTYTYLDKALPLTEQTLDIQKVYSYDVMGRVKTAKDGNGNLTAFEYDKLGRQTKTTNPDGSVATTEYILKDTSGNVVNQIIATDESGRKLEYKYDMLGRVEYVKDVASGYLMEQYSYDAMNRVSKLSDGDLNALTFEYDKQGRMTSQASYDSQERKVLYQQQNQYIDAFDAETSKVITIQGSGDTVVKSATYTDKYGNVVKEAPGDTSNILQTKRYEYDYAGNKTKELMKESATASDKARYQYTYAAVANAGTQATTKDVYNHSSVIKYNMAGQQVSVQDGNGHTQTSVYDNAGRLVSVKGIIDGADSVKSYEYDGNGNVTKETITTNKPGEATVTRSVYKEYDNRNRVIKTYSDEEGATVYEYDAVGHMTKLTTGLTAENTVGQTTLFEYDTRGRLIKKTDAMGQIEIYAYDNKDNLISLVDRNGVVTSNVYDGFGNLTTSTAANTVTGESDSISYQYTNAGMLKQLSNASESVNYLYDTRGLLSMETESGSGRNIQKQYTYDNNLNPSGLNIKNNGAVILNQENRYNHINQMTGVYEVGSATPIVTYEYDAAGNLIKENRKNSVETVYQYNESNLLKQMSNKKGSTVLSSYAYDYYLDGNQSKVTDNTGRIQTCQYDGAGRLKQETDTAGSNKAYTYDSYGNRARMSVTGAETYTTDYLYDANNRIVKETKATGTEREITDYNYDPNGNLLNKAYGRMSAASIEPESLQISVGESSEPTLDIFTYTLRNQLKTAAVGGKTASYHYDPTGMRLSKTVDGVSTNQIWSGGNVVAEYGAQNAVYRYGVKLVDMTQNSVQNYYLYNGHGDTTQLVNASGTVTANYQYDAFGNPVGNGANNVYNPFRYNCQYTDDETGFIYLRNRYYDPSIGRFITEDPIKADFNYYTYAKNNPIRFIDPIGLAAGDVFDSFDKMLADASRTTGKTQTESSISWSSTVNANGTREYFWYVSQSSNQQTQNVISAINANKRGFLTNEAFMTNLRTNGISVPSTSTVTAGALRVPIYNQMDTPPKDTTNNLCWATSAAMVASLYLGDTTDRTLAIAMAITGATTVTGYNQPWSWVSTDDPALGLGITAGQTQTSGTLSMSEIQTTIDGGIPFGVLYRDAHSGHWVVGTGYINIQGGGQYVISNNPWGGIQSIQTYNDFKTLPDGRTWTWTAQ